jgi:dTDP-4-dehydrorhamnose reductase
MEAKQPMELWGGVECTINRVGDRYSSQLELSGHRERADEDLERFAQLGMRTLRFPILWENLAPDSLDEIDWRWTDARLAKLQSLGIRPIAGLLHHGSGPPYTSLLDPEFPEKLARFAGEVARRYPWIDAYTPVNEPLTTARFSALYGHWYPHARDGHAFAQAFVNQCRGITLAMRAIRKVNSAAALVQTEDLGRSYSTPRLAYQADFENERRWLTWDILSGMLDREHPLWSYFEWVGFDLAALEFFTTQPCPPDLIGINYYVTSERYLDEQVENYPTESWGNNGRDAYADDAAVRARAEGLEGSGGLLRETFMRYGAPTAITEVHLGCTEDEQLRWFMENWTAAEEARRDGVDVRAVTAWSLLGSFDWDSLVTESRGHYEAGVFDISSGDRRPTLLASALPLFAQGAPFRHPVLESPGWWRRRSRLRQPARQSFPEFA